MTTTDKAPATRARLGSAPDSWGVWFPDHPQQSTGTRFLDEIAEAGYHWMELGPYGFLPTDPSQLADELAARDLHVSAGTVGGAFHKKDELEALTQEALRVAKLAAAVGGKYLVLLPAMYRDLLSGDYLEDKTLDTEGWKQFIRSCEEVSRAVQQETGLRAVFHPHADSHVETQQQTYRWLDDTDADAVGLCLDTGHIEYGGGDSAEIMRRYPQRIEYMHFKQVDPELMKTVRDKDLAFADAVKLGAICEPPKGIPTAESIAAQMHLLNPELFVIVEQDMFPCDPDDPLPIAARTCGYLRSVPLAL
ncbi:sugar phosphate isomerase/epimerase family protein [Propionibacterium freudenreichii]|uniref:sugar phosphate isomerase/epimerase family protein n=1 Tax=Propionibacterium freudenreichii TaxID=1744 RepID=UPI0021A6FCC9|nr:sugar phosphate isomerase/epimerase [Propionibacterium freudenreichii]MCT2980003.1 2-keto-myo-inositol dehydratase [Propionibacterium freudenreichii]